MLVGRKYFVSSEYEKKWIEDAINNNQNQVKLAVCLRENDEHIGNVYLNNINWFNRSGDFGLLIGEKEHWGKGYGEELTLLMLNHAFYDLGLIRIESRQLLTNKASIKVHKKCGFKNEGILRKAVYKNGEYRDLNLMSIIRSDFDNLLKAKNLI
jgi:RimJ/RimL family protein N-acetyltransferase